MKKLLLVLSFAVPVLLFAGPIEMFNCVINDKDGYTFIRSGPGKEHPVIDTVYENWFFTVYGDTTSAWLHVHHYPGKPGYMHKSRVAFFYKLDSLTQRSIIVHAFNELMYAVQSEDRYYRNLVYEGKYLPAYYEFEKLFCQNPDTSLLCLFFRTLPYIGGSADEGIVWTSAAMWLCHPDEVKMSVCALTKEERNCAISEIKMGMAMSGKEDDYTPKKLKAVYTELDKPCE